MAQADSPGAAIGPEIVTFTLSSAVGDGSRHPATTTTAIPSVAVPPGGQRAAARKAWLAAVGERHRALSPEPGSVPRLRDISAEAFLDLFYAAGRPVVIEGLARDWPATSLWSIDYLAAKVGSAEITFQGGRDSAADFELAKDRHIRTMPFDRYLADFVAKNGGNDAYITAYNSGANRAAFAPLMADLGQAPYLSDAEGMLWIGPAGTFTPLHHDLTNNLLVQIVGAKRLHLLPPGETERLANNRHVFSDVHDIEDPMRTSLFPQAREARRFVVDLRPGDALFIPVGWWHQVRSLSFSVMLTYTNFLWPNDAHTDFPGD